MKGVICDDAEAMRSSLMSSSGFMFPCAADSVPVGCSYDCADQQQQQQLNKSRHWTADGGTSAPQPLHSHSFFFLFFFLLNIMQPHAGVRLCSEVLELSDGVRVFAAAAWM